MRLYERLAEAGCHIDSAAEISRAYETHSETVEAWLDEAAEALVVAVIGVQAADDLDAVIVDTDLPSFLGDRLIERINAVLSSASASAIAAPPVTKSILGRNAAALGAALLPIHDLFAPKLSVLARGQAKRRRTKAVS
jgi:predicted NBD/HSP70 family sugar kinase